MSKRTTILFITLWGLFHILGAWWSRDLTMYNAEHLFMSHSGAEDYHRFRDLVGEKRVLAVKIELDHDMSELEYTRLRDGIRSLKEQYPEPDFQWLDFHTTYQRKLTSANFVDTKAFWTAQPNLLLPLFSDRHGGFVVMINWNVTDSKIAELTSTIQSYSSFRIGHVAMAGLPWVNIKLNQYAQDIKLILMPVMFAVCFLMTLFLIRSLPGTILMIVASIFALTSSMALIKLLYGSLNMITAVVPLRVFVVNLTLCFYIYFSAIEHDSFRKAIVAKWRPLAMGLAATALGFGANAVSSIPAVRQVAIVAMVAVIFAGFSSVFLLWMIESLRGTWIRLYKTRLDEWQLKLPLWNSSKQKWILSAVFAGAIVAATQVPILTDATQYFPKASGIKADLDRVETGFLGTPVFEVILHKKDGSDFAYDDYKVLAAVESLLMKNLGSPYKTLSLNALATEANRLFSGVDSIPDNKFAWMTLMGGMPENVKGSFPAGAYYRVSLLGKALNHDSFLRDRELIRSTLASTASNYEYELNGLNYNLMQSQEDLIKVLTLSFFGSVLVILGLFFLFFKDARRTVVFAIWMLAPAAFGVCLMYLLGFSLNIATVMSFGVALGIVVSGLIHIAYVERYTRNDKSMYAETLLPLATAATVLTVGFGLFGFNQFLPIHQEGILVAVMIAAGGISAIATRSTR